MEESADEHENEPLNKQQYVYPTVTEQIGSIISIDDGHMESTLNEESAMVV